MVRENITFRDPSELNRAGIQKAEYFGDAKTFYMKSFFQGFNRANSPNQKFPDGDKRKKGFIDPADVEATHPLGKKPSGHGIGMGDLGECAGDHNPIETTQISSDLVCLPFEKPSVHPTILPDRSSPDRNPVLLSKTSPTPADHDHW